MRQLGDNPLYRLEQRRQWRGLGVPALLLGLFCCGCGPGVAFFLAPSLTAIAVVRDKRGRVWEDLLLTRLTNEEILLGKLLPALHIPLLLTLVGAGLGLMAGILLPDPPSLSRAAELLQRLGAGLASGLGVLAFTLPTVVMGGLAGLLGGLRYRDSFNAAAFGCLIALVAEGTLWILTARVGGSFPLWVVSPGAPRAYASALIPAGLLFLLGHALVIAGLWQACQRALRQGR